MSHICHIPRAVFIPRYLAYTWNKIKLGIWRSLMRIDPGAAHEVEGHQGLGQEFVPKVQRKIAVGAAEAGDEMIT